MKRTQVQIPDWLFAAAREVARRQEVSLAELVRRGLEHILNVTPGAMSEPAQNGWALPPAMDLGARDDVLQNPDWREALHMDRLRVAEEGAPYGRSQGQ
jgi:hypothetical protein